MCRAFYSIRDSSTRSFTKPGQDEHELFLREVDLTFTEQANNLVSMSSARRNSAPPFAARITKTRCRAEQMLAATKHTTVRVSNFFIGC